MTVNLNKTSVIPAKAGIQARSVIAARRKTLDPESADRRVREDDGGLE